MKEDEPKFEERASIRKQAEDVLTGKTSDFKNLSSGDAQHLVHELQVHQIELEMQNEELRRVQKELEEAHNRYFDLYDFAPIGYFTFDKRGLILEVNLTGANKLGIERRNLIKKPFSLYVAPDHKEAFYSLLREVFDTETQMTRELRLLNKNGSQFDVLLDSMPVLDSEGNLLARTAISDFTERKRADDALQESEYRYRNLVENARDVIFTLSIDGKLTSLNLAFETVTDWSRDELIGKSFTSIIYPDDVPLFIERHKRLLHGETLPVSEFRIIMKSGIYIILEISTSLQIQDGNVTGILGIARDITKRKLIEKGLHESEERYRSLVDLSPFGIAITSERKIVYINQQGAKIQGAGSPSEIIGKSLFEEGKSAAMMEDKLLKLDGTAVDVELMAIPFIYQGKAANYAVFRDISS
jgi:PAS domain S-box-containing protein